MDELIDLFPDNYIHLGGDEIDNNYLECNDNIRQYLSTNHITTKYNNEYIFYYYYY